ncbi:MAG: S9 family peptidase, partial [Gammaproteobacteria bacterium]|nr:S9 family peptidase [Gammaproteobacteria bacterium]
MQKMLAISIAGLCLGATSSLMAKPFEVTDLIKLDSVHSASVSPNGDFLVYGHKQVSPDLKESNLYLKDLTKPNSVAVQITSHLGTEHDVVWSSDSKSIYFIANRDKTSQVWKLNLSGGEAIAVTDLAIDVHGLKLSPDNSLIALSLTTFNDCKDIECTAKRLKEIADQPNKGKEYTQLFVRHWDTWKDHSYNHIFVGKLAGIRVTGLVDVNQGLATDIPAKPFSGMEEVSFTPDSQHIVYSAKKDDEKQPFHTNFDLWQVAVTGGAAVNLTSDNQAWDSQPVFSVDGRYMAYAAMSRPIAEADRFAIMLKDLVTGNVKEVAPLWDRSVRSITFAPDSRNLYVTAQDVGQVSVFVVNIQFGDIKALHSDGSSSIIGVSHDNLIIGKKGLSHPTDYYSLPLDGSDITAVTAVNKQKLAEIEFGEYSQFSFKGWNDETVHGYWVKPAGYKKGQKYPIAFLIHGGPQGSFGNSFSTRWNPQLWAGAGYGVVMIDFHGSTGYGQEFTDSISLDWGGKPLEDLQKGLAAVTKQQPWLDADNACALGGSYGGYMVNWIAGQWSDQFKCLVNHAGLFDMRMFYKLTEELWFPERDFGGSYLDAKDNYEKFNPANFVNNWKTPMLVIHGEKDFRVPYGQGLAAFTVLQR